MIKVKHRGDAIEAETVEVKALEPILTIGEEEVEHLIFPVVKAHRVPRRVEHPLTAMEVLGVGAVKAGEPLLLVPRCMGVDDIHDDKQPEPVRLVD